MQLEHLWVILKDRKESKVYKVYRGLLAHKVYRGLLAQVMQME
jgi:hypothetical protein